MTERNSSRLRARAATLVVLLWGIVAAYGALRPGAGRVPVAFANDLAMLLGVLCLALVAGIPLGALAGSGPRWIDTGLGFMTDWMGALPAVLLLAFVRPDGYGFWLSVVWLGVLRALELAWVVRSALLRAAAEDETWSARSLGYVPLAIFLSRRLPSAARPALAHAALTPLWTFLLDAVGTSAGLGAASSERSFGALVAHPTTAAPGVTLLAIVAVVVLTWALHVLGERYSLRLGRK